MNDTYPAAKPPPHVHERLHEYFYLLDGEIRFQLGTEVKTATGGGMLSVPPNSGCRAMASSQLLPANSRTPTSLGRQS